MVADSEEIRQREIPPPRQAKVEEQWQRGQEVQVSCVDYVRSVIDMSGRLWIRARSRASLRRRTA
jgi:hypothetical protein